MHSAGEKISGPSAIIVRPMFPDDVSAVLCLLKESPEAAPWSRASLLEMASQGSAWVGELNGCVAGILIGRVAADEFEILNLAISKACRRHGIATRLVSAAVRSAQPAGARRTYLEVRASNGGGIAFYMRIGFRVCGRRPNYYREPVEDAVLLVLEKP